MDFNVRRSKLKVLFLASCCFSLVNAQFKETELLIEAVTSSSLPPEHSDAATNAVASNSTEAEVEPKQLSEAEVLSENLPDLSLSIDSPLSSANNNSDSTLENINLEVNSSLPSSINISEQLDQPNEHVKANDLRTPVIENCITDTLFVVDSTSSVAKIFGQHKEYIAKVAELLNISTQGNHISLLVYSGKLRHRVTYHFGANQEKRMAMKMVRDLPFMGGVTSTGVALDHAFIEITNTRRANDTTVNIVIITDGFSYDPVDVQCQNLRQLPKVRTFAVAVGDMRSEPELLIMAGKPENLFQGPDSYVDLVERLTTCEPDAILSNSLDKPSATSQLPQNDFSQNTVAANDKGFTSQITAQIKPSSTSKNTDTNNSVNNDGNLQQSDDQGYSQVEEQCPTDVVFVFDASGSLQESAASSTYSWSHSCHQVQWKRKIKSHFATQQSSNQRRDQGSNSGDAFFGGTTFTNEALVKAVAELQNSTTSGDKKQIVVVFTDGFSFEDVTPGSKTLHDNGVTVLAVAFNEQFPVNRDELETLTWHKSENVFMESNYKELKQKLRQLTKC
uniref:VWFA domain-containing protein n=1 Tax=Ditylenchus dipsaci TaxID=166011 RepID=A0A915CX60_9BILA